MENKEKENIQSEKLESINLNELRKEIEGVRELIKNELEIVKEKVLNVQIEQSTPLVEKEVETSNIIEEFKLG